MDYIKVPYPNQIVEYAKKNHHAFFKEPVGERSTPNLGRLADSQWDTLVKVHAPAFGSISPIYADQVGDAPLRTFFRENRGTVHHGLGRTDEDNYECAKFSVLRHPRPDDFNNPDYAGPEGKVTGLNQAYLKLVNYPKVPGVVMSAPLMPRHGPASESTKGKDGHFKLPQAQQPSAFTRVFEMPELFEKILLEVGHRWGDLSNLSRTCQTAMFAIDKVSTRVDLTAGNFLNLDKTEEAIAETAAEVMASEDENKTCKIPVSPSATIVIISNIRNQFFEAKDEKDPNEFGYPAFLYNRERLTVTSHQLIHLHMLLKSVYLRGSQMKMLHLHGVPFLDVAFLRRCLRHLPNLEVLGVHSCELLHFGTTIDVMKQVIAHNSEPGFQRVRSDFSPYYYKGPQRQGKYYKGEFGVIPSDQGTIETRRAIAAVLSTAIPLALDNGIDWFTPGTGMRQFLERIPFELGTLRYILEAIYNIYYFNKGITGPKYHPDKKKDLPHHLCEKLHEACERTLYGDLVLAVHGKSMAQKALRSTMSFGPRFHLVKCAYCKIELPSFFFTTQSVARHISQVECSGCQLIRQLELQIDNFFPQKRDTLVVMFKDDRFTDTESYLYTTIVAEEDDISDPNYPFWALAVKPKAHFEAWLKENANGSQNGVVLDGRPGPNHPAEFKEVRLWQEKLFQAMDYVTRYIDQAPSDLYAEVLQCMANIQILDNQQLTLTSSAAGRENRNKAEDFRRWIDQKLAVGGVGQMGGIWGTTAAASWDREVQRYRQLIMEQVGLLWNNGPYNTVRDHGKGFYW